MPVCGSLTADIIMNPHMLPTRMTCGQLLETVASKYGVASGQFVDCTPYQSIDIEELMSLMKGIGYEEYGRDTMICGLTGKKMERKIFFGPIYLQRLKHMVTEKVHACGASVRPAQSTRQPIDGRSRGGAYRVGELLMGSALCNFGENKFHIIA